MKMKKILCKFANWILRKCVKPIALEKNLYINGRTYKLAQLTMEMSPYSPHTTIYLEIIEDK